MNQDSKDIGQKLVFETKKNRISSLALYILSGTIIILVALTIFLAMKVAYTSEYAIPEQIVNQSSHTIFVPSKLPSNFKISSNSFSVSEETLIFNAQDSSGSSIFFTEQKRPDNFDFDGFYAEQLEDAKRLDKTPFPSYVGKSSADGSSLVLSIVTDDTWIIVSTRSLLSEQDFVKIAQSIEPYKR